MKPTGTALDAAAQAFAAAAQVLNGRASLMEAVRFYMRHNSHTRTINTAVAIDEFIRAKQTAKRSVHTLHGYEMRLNAVKKAFGKVDLDQIGSAELKAFLRNPGRQERPIIQQLPRSRHHVLSMGYEAGLFAKRVERNRVH